MRFLTDGNIFQAVRRLVNGDKELLAAVAFWGRGAGNQTGISERAAPTRILCDLLSGACNPAEIKHLLENGAEVKYRPHLHAKVWVSGNEVVVGSANASTNGLGFETSASNIEAAVYLRDKKMAGNVRKWFECEWDLAEDIDEVLLRTAEAMWNQRQRAGSAIMRCFLTAYVNQELSEEARNVFDQIAQDHYNEQKWAEILAEATQYNEHVADSTCYELPPFAVPLTIGTVYMDYSRYQNGTVFEFGGFWEVVHNEIIQETGSTLCLLAKRDGRHFRANSCGGSKGRDTMVNCYLDREGREDMDMEFRTFYFLQRERYCNNVQERCDSCPFANMNG